MRLQVKAAIAVLFVASLPMYLRAEVGVSSSELLTARDVRSAEKQARTAEDHLRLATWYRAKASQAQNDLVAQEELVNHLAQEPGMLTRTKIPNPYWSAQAMARVYRERVETATNRAATHQKLAESMAEASSQATAKSAVR